MCKMEALLVALALTCMAGVTISVTVPISSIHAATLHNSRRFPPHPCSYSISGTWANTTVIYITPYPPKANQPANVYVNFTAVDDLWYGNVRGNVTRLEDKWEYSFDFSLCGSEGICPIRKGENRVYNETFPSPSTFGRKGTYRAWGVITNQDDEVIYNMALDDCPIK